MQNSRKNDDYDIDQQNRIEALNTKNSYIVEAGAGSGKTTLLVNRYLALLSCVNYPEEILAITFTKKAAEEMQNRVLNALQNSEKIRKKNLENNWQILENPARLKIQTIDSLCNSLTKQMPILSGLLSDPEILDEVDSKELYRKAINSVLETPEEIGLTKTQINSIETLLLHLDNDYDRTENLFLEMLKKREQWLPHVINLRHSKEILEESLQNVIHENITKCQKHFPQNLQNEIGELLIYALKNLQESDDYTDFLESNLQVLDFNDNFYCMFLGQNTGENPRDACNASLRSNYLPTPQDKNTRDAHIGRLYDIFCKIFLTKEFQWRKSIDKRNGFPAKDDGKNKEEKTYFLEMKNRMRELLQTLQDEKYAAFLNALCDFANSPNNKYSENQWQIIYALLEILPIMVAKLTLLFREQNAADYTEIALAADRALGDFDNPTKLALNLDYRIKHILVDEFQDTSILQFRLLEKLIAGWQQNDGRTLFLVGDPMQSIYRFRQAEVGLFLRAQNEGIGNLKLKRLVLSHNYRSTKNIVDWVNFTFSKIMPKFSDIVSGAITFNPAQAMSENVTQNSIVKIHKIVNENEESNIVEANYVTKLLKDTIKQEPNDTIALLARSKNHVAEIINSLKKENIPYHAVELETLTKKIVCRDLLSLTKAIFNLKDKISWLAILRAPFIGLNLHDLHAIAKENFGETVWENLLNFARIPNLSEPAKANLTKIVPIIANSLNSKYRKNLRDLIETVWQNLKGALYFQTQNELETAQAFFTLLEKNGTEIYTINTDVLEQKLNYLFAPTKTSEDAKIQIMTIHKAKGLEFDTVIVTGLDRIPRHDDNNLLMWMEKPRVQNGADLILAPIGATYENHDATYSYLQNMEKIKNDYEIGRLLYVAATRAKKNLHLVARLTKKTEDPTEYLAPGKNTLLAKIWDELLINN